MEKLTPSVSAVAPNGWDRPRERTSAGASKDLLVTWYPRSSMSFLTVLDLSPSVRPGDGSDQRLRTLVEAGSARSLIRC